MKREHSNVLSASADRYDILKDYARANRMLSTDAEYVLWQHLRKSQLGVRFRRQHAIYDYIVDFFCISEMLIIEIDGEYHNEEEQAKLDFQRQQKLEQLGYRIIRFTNDQILFHIDVVLEGIKKHIVFTNIITPL